jgi:hypothetical protein
MMRRVWLLLIDVSLFKFFKIGVVLVAILWSLAMRWLVWENRIGTELLIFRLERFSVIAIHVA